LPDGAPCAYGDQCASNLCASDEGHCGQCAPMPSKVGDSCDPTTRPCDPRLGLVCNASYSCYKPARRGAACQVDGDCLTDLLCTGGKCSDYVTTLGATCDQGQQTCSFGFGAGLVCDDSSKCQQPIIAKIGDGCGKIAGGLVAVCEKGSICDGSVDG